MSGPSDSVEPPLHLVDASIYIFRAWFSLPDTLRDASGAPFNAVYGYTRFLCELLEVSRTRRLAVAFDQSLTTSFRNDLYPAYKANRELPPPELESQFVRCRELTAALGVTVLASARYEADDLIASACRQARRLGWRAVVVSSDKDLGQLVCDDVELWDFAAGRRYGVPELRERYGVLPQQLGDYLALVGDAVDNVPGVPGVGRRTAAALLARFGTLEALLENLEQVADCGLRNARRVARSLAENRERLALSRRLIGLAADVPIPGVPGALHRRAPDGQALTAVLGEQRRGLIERLIQATS